MSRSAAVGQTVQLSTSVLAELGSTGGFHAAVITKTDSLDTGDNDTVSLTVFPAGGAVFSVVGVPNAQVDSSGPRSWTWPD